VAVLSQEKALEALHKLLWPAWLAEKEELDKIDLLWRNEHEHFAVPRQATTEHKALRELARTPYLGLIVNAITQGLHVDSYRSPTVADNDPGWKTWVQNGMPKNQNPIHRAATGYGLGYLRLVKGDPLTVMKPRSPRQMLTLYADPAYDEWPMWAMEVIANGPDKSYMVEAIDNDGNIYRFSVGDDTGEKAEFIEAIDGEADYGFCPVVRYTYDLDTEGRTRGVVEINRTTALRIEKTDYDRLLAQHFNSWKVRTIAGMAEPDDTEDLNRKKLKLAQEDILVAEDPDTKFGTLDATALDGFIKAKESDVESLAGTGQVPGTALTGKVSNLSAEAITELRSGLNLLQFTLKTSYGQSHNQALRAAALLEGRQPDYDAGVTWQDLNTLSLAASVDALGKACTMLGIPPEALWSSLPGFTQSDVKTWEAMATKDASRRRLDDLRTKAAEARGVVAAAGLGTGRSANA
jgi:SPP1 Gp6-like portal protein